MIPTGTDEMVNGQGGLRPHWHQLLSIFWGLGDPGLSEHAARLDAAFADEGVSGILPGAGGREQWRCDPLPLPLPASEFQALTEGLAQRAELLELVLHDLYGAQSTLADGLLPPALVFANPGFLRPCHMAPGGTNTPAPGRFLDFYAADLLRGPDGQWRVLADRSSGAAGVAYARENRRMLARVLPDVFRGMHMRPLRPFFEAWQTVLQRMSRPGGNAPGVALLTPGTGSSHWFEHMMLARELSCALVESGDLTVRGGGVFLKTLKGLQPVDVLLRRVDAQQLDPLELSGSGVPGLLDAMRNGSVRVSNHPGTGLVEAPGLAAFLPALAMRLLGEPLRLPSVETLWLGEQSARESVAALPEDWLIRSSVDGVPGAVEPLRLDQAKRAALNADIAREPWRFAATRAMAPSVAPCAGPGGLVPRPLILRLFLLHDGERWVAMEGGLARVIEPGEQVGGALPGEGLSKDVWVLHDDRDEQAGMPAPPVPPVAIRRTQGDLPSRVADDMFWLGRYVERLESSARLVQATITRLMRSTGAPSEIIELEALSRSLANARLIPGEVGTVAGGGVALSEALLASLYEDTRPRGALAEHVREVARLTELVRDRLTGDMYAVFTAGLRQIRADARRVNHSLDRLAVAMADILHFAAAFAGLAAENMVRGGGWMFLELGRRVERGQAIADDVGFALDQPPARLEPALRLALELCDSLITYRARYLTVLQPAPVLDLVLADEGNPRGLAFQLIALGKLLDQIAGKPDSLLAGTAAELLVEARALASRVLDAPDQATAAAALPSALHALSEGIGALSDRVGRHYFALLPVAQTLGMNEEALPVKAA